MEKKSAKEEGKKDIDELTDILDTLNLESDPEIKKIFENGNTSFITFSLKFRVSLSFVQSQKIQ